MDADSFVDARCTPEMARAFVRRLGPHLLVEIDCPGPILRRVLIGDFRASFPHHGDRYWRRGTREWCLPAQLRVRLEAWLDGWFVPEAIRPGPRD